MKINIVKKLLKLSVLLILPTLTGCAAGSVTAGYAIKAREADYLTAVGEQRIVNRVKQEVMLELNAEPPCDHRCY